MTAASLHTIDTRRRRARSASPAGPAALAALAGLAALLAQSAFAQVATRLEKIEVQSAARRASRCGCSSRPRAAAAGLHDRQPRPPVGGPAGHDAGAAVTAHGRELRRRRHHRRGRSLRPHAGWSSTSTAGPYQTRVDGNAVVVTARPRRRSLRRHRPALAAPGAGRPAAASSARRIDKVDFRRGADGAGRVIVSPAIPRRPGQPEAGRRPDRGRFPEYDAARRHAQRMDVVDFATPVSSIDVTRTAAGARIVVAAAGDFEQLAYQSDSEYVLEVGPVPRRRSRRPERPRIHGRAPDPQLPGHRDPRGAAAAGRDQRPEHRRVRHGPGQRDAAPAERPLGPGDGHRAATKGLDKRQKGNVIIVAPADEIAAREKADARGAEGDPRARRRSAPSTCRSTTRRLATSRS